MAKTFQQFAVGDEVNKLTKSVGELSFENNKEQSNMKRKQFEQEQPFMCTGSGCSPNGNEIVKINSDGRIYLIYEDSDNDNETIDVIGNPTHNGN